MNAPAVPLVPEKPRAPRTLWPHIHAAFTRGADTAQIADDLKITEAEVANFLHDLREQARAR